MLDARRLCCKAIGLVGLLLPALCGCTAADQLGEQMFAPLRQVLGMKKPVRVGVTKLHINPLVPAPWEPLRAALEKELARPVQVVMCKPFQARELLRTGYLDFAILSPTDFAEVAREKVCKVIAQPVNSLGRTEHCGLIVTAKDCPIKALSDLKGKRFAFGPEMDAFTHIAAADVLREAGLGPKDISLELLPVPLSYRHHVDSYEVAKAVIYEGLPAGAVDELDYVTWPETGGTMLPVQTVSRDQLRILAKTVCLPEGPIVASTKADPTLVEKVSDFLLNKAAKQRKILEPMHWSGFRKVGKEQMSRYEEVARMVNVLRKAGWLPAEVPAPVSATQPAG